MNRIEKVSKNPSCSIAEVAKMCGQDITVVQEWCRNGLHSIEGRIFLDRLFWSIDDGNIEGVETPLLMAAREEYERRGGHIAERIFPDYGKVA